MERQPTTFDWQRYWCPREGKLNLSDGGFLVDPLTLFGDIENDCVAISTIDSFRFLGLLGEPGIGKTTELKRYTDRVVQGASASSSPDLALTLDLERCNDHKYLQRELTENADYKSWIAGTCKLFLCMENLERLGVRPHLFAEDLESVLGSCPIDRLYVRIASRTFDWPRALESKMIGVFGRDAVRVFELAPLTRANARKAAEVILGDPKQFMIDLDASEAVPFANRPITLHFILNKYKDTGQIPTSASEIFAEGCEILCQELNEELGDAKHTGKYSPKQRLAVASRIAAVLLFSQRYAISTALPQNFNADDVRLCDLIQGQECFGGITVDVTKESLEESVNCGLFTSRGQDRLGFAHQTYGEFLASRFLIERRVTPVQILSLLVHPEDPENRIVPQLAGVAGWLSEIPEIYSYIVERDPQILMFSDLAAYSDAQREMLVEQYLEVVGKEKLWLHDIDERYAKLKHANLSNQVKKIILDQSRDVIARMEAVRIAIACKPPSLMTEMIAIALDQAVTHEVRQVAALFVVQVGGRDDRLKLMPLALGLAGNDPQDDLKGFGLSAVYSEHLTTAQLISNITPFKDERIVGAYSSFLNSTFFERLPNSDIPIALDWVLTQPLHRSLQNKLGHFVNKIVYHAWKNAGDAAITRAFANVALDRLLNHVPVVDGIHAREFRSDVINDHEKLRAVLRDMIDISDQKGKECAECAFAIHCFIPKENDEFSWLIELLSTERRPYQRKLLANLLWHQYKNTLENVEALFEATKAHLEVYQRFRLFLLPMDLDSQEAKDEKEKYEQLVVAFDEVKKVPKTLVPPRDERIAIRLEQSENGSPGVWQDLTKQLRLDEDGVDRGGDLEFILRETPGWKKADCATKERILAAASRYLNDPNCDPKTEMWLGTDKVYAHPIAGLKALVLLSQECPEALSKLSEEDWKRWVGVLVGFSDGDARKELPPIIAAAYAKVPSDLLSVLVRQIEYQNSEPNGSLSVLDGFVGSFDETSFEMLVSMLDSGKLTNRFVIMLVTRLVEAKSDLAKRWAESRCTQSDQIAAMCATVLLDQFTQESWPIVWKRIEGDKVFGGAVLSALARNSWDSEKLLPKFTDDQLSDLFVWLMDNYPDEGNQGGEIVKTMGALDWIHDLRSSIPPHVSKRDTKSARDAISALSVRYPSMKGLRRMAAESRDKFRELSWRPYNPEYILQLASNKEVRLVASENDLLNVIQESLARLQKRLQSHRPINEQLWNEITFAFLRKKECQKVSSENGKVYVPKDEVAACNFVAAYLESDLKGRGVVINREVEVRYNPGAKGERTDIYIDAVAKDEKNTAYKRVTVVIEAKGLWNNGLLVDMEKQLVNQYLKDASSQTGIYLPFHFNCAQWDDDDYRKQDSMRHTLQNAKAALDAQAESLTKGGLRVACVILDASLRERPHDDTKPKQSS